MKKRCCPIYRPVLMHVATPFYHFLSPALAVLIQKQQEKNKNVIHAKDSIMYMAMQMNSTQEDATSMANAFIHVTCLLRAPAG